MTNNSLTGLPSAKARFEMSAASQAAACGDLPGVRSKSCWRCCVARRRASAETAWCSIDSCGRREVAGPARSTKWRMAVGSAVCGSSWGAWLNSTQHRAQ